MDDEQDYITLAGIKDIEVVQIFFYSSMVDVAYVSSVSGNTIEVIVEDDIDLTDPNDQQWITEIIMGGLKECGETQATMQIVTHNQSA